MKVLLKNIKLIMWIKKPVLSIDLKYYSGNPVISTFERVSKPGRRIFSSADSLPKINGGLGVAIVSTPKGVMTDVDARKQKVGGEIICKVF
jgi:small subunit ribosomal protein S8